MHQGFSDLKEEFLRIWAYHNPTYAAFEGWREFAGNVALPRKEVHDSYLHSLEIFEKRLKSLNEKELSEIEKMDYELMLNKIDAERFGMETLDNYRTNPLSYVGAAFIFDYLLKDYAPINQRLSELILHLHQLPDYYKIAKGNLDVKEIAKENAEMAMFMLSGMANFLTNILSEVKELSESLVIPKEIEKDLTSAGELGSKAITNFVEFLKESEEEFGGEFKLGKANYQKMLWTNERVGISIEKIIEAGEKNLERNLKEFNKAAKEIDPNKDPKELIQEIKKDHPTTDSLIDDTQNMLEGIRSFLIETNFVSVPSKVMPTVIYTPKPYREWAFAAMNTPGALEKKATDSYYYITPPDEEWDEKEKEDWLQTFNYPGLLDICVHEVFPGHYLHHLHNQRSKSIMSKLFGVYHFWEGYALYVEEAMYQHGFHKDDPKYRMAQLVETLLRNVRLICSIRLHTDPDFTVEDATQMFMDKVFMGRKPAESEAKRGTYDPGYLNYALGKLMIEKLRSDYKEENKEHFNSKEFHDKLLSYGAPPVPILRKYMLENEEIHDEIL